MSALALPHRQRKKALPPPLVKITKHPMKWSLLKAQTILTGLLAAFFIGVPTIAALYYLLLETHVGIGHLGIYVHGRHIMNQTALWHALVPDGTQRHTYRDVMEGFYGGIIGHAVAWSHYKRPNKVWKKLSGLSVLKAIVLAFILAVPGFFLGEAIVHVFSDAIKLFTTTPGGVSESTWATIRGTVTENLPKKIIGLTSAFFFGRHAMYGVYDGIQRGFAERRIVLHKPLHFYHTPAFKARINDLTSSGTVTWKPSQKATTIMLLSATVFIGLAAYGWYVLQVIAKHH